MSNQNDGATNKTPLRIKSLEAVYIRRDSEGNEIARIPLGVIAGEEFSPLKHKVRMLWLRLRHPEWWKLQKQLSEGFVNG